MIEKKKNPLKDDSYIFYKYHEESKHHKWESSDTVKEILQHHKNFRHDRKKQKDHM